MKADASGLTQVKPLVKYQLATVSRTQESTYLLSAPPLLTDTIFFRISCGPMYIYLQIYSIYLLDKNYVCMYVCICMHACVCLCVRACLHAYVRSSVDQFKIFVQGRISRPISGSKLIFHMRTYLYETSRTRQEPWPHDLYFTVHWLRTLARLSRLRFLSKVES